MNTQTSIHVASRLLELGNEQNVIAITPMKLIKLTYLCHGWMLGFHGRPLVRENVEAWHYGPVIPELDAVVRQYKSNAVKSLPEDPDACEFDEIQQAIINETYLVYGSYTVAQLSELTVAEVTPWHITWDGGKGENTVIPNHLIEAHFASIVRT